MRGVYSGTAIRVQLLFRHLTPSKPSLLQYRPTMPSQSSLLTQLRFRLRGDPKFECLTVLGQLIGEELYGDKTVHSVLSFVDDTHSAPFRRDG